jgi:hypothetical protein
MSAAIVPRRSARFIRGANHGDARIVTASLSDQYADAPPNEVSPIFGDGVIGQAAAIVG